MPVDMKIVFLVASILLGVMILLGFISAMLEVSQGAERMSQEVQKVRAVPEWRAPVEPAVSSLGKHSAIMSEGP